MQYRRHLLTYLPGNYFVRLFVNSHEVINERVNYNEKVNIIIRTNEY